MKTYKYRIYPTGSQQNLLWKHSIALNRLHNKLIEIEEQNYKEGNKFLAQYDLNNLLPEQVVLFQLSDCPVCKKHDSFLKGPSGGACTNIKCEGCGTCFNVMVLPEVGLAYAEII